MAKWIAACTVAWLSAALAGSSTLSASTLDAAKLAAILGPGVELVQRLDGDLNRDGEIDTAYVARDRDGYRVGVVLAYRSEGTYVHDDLQPLRLRSASRQPPLLDRTDEVLRVRHARIGAATTSAAYRYRYDPYEHEMILIGLDAERGGTSDGDRLRLEWNLLTGEQRVWRGRNAPGDAVVRRSLGERAAKPLWMVHTPDPDALLDAELAASRDPPR